MRIRVAERAVDGLLPPATRAVERYGAGPGAGPASLEAGGAACLSRAVPVRRAPVTGARRPAGRVGIVMAADSSHWHTVRLGRRGRIRVVEWIRSVPFRAARSVNIVRCY